VRHGDMRGKKEEGGPSSRRAQAGGGGWPAAGRGRGRGGRCRMTWRVGRRSRRGVSGRRGLQWLAVLGPTRKE
jgi:hypothetical protein